MNLESTSKENYITGMTALNIPDENGNFADWHFTETFLSGKGKCFIAGKNMPDTSAVFGDYGIRECSETLRCSGVEIREGVTVYTANFVRAILDLLFDISKSKGNPNFIELDDLLDEDKDKEELFLHLKALKSFIKDKSSLEILQGWENANTHQ